MVTVRLAPQLSGAVLLPHCAPTRVQKMASTSGVQPHTLGTLGVAPPQLAPVPLQVPQLTVRVTPQLLVPLLLPHCAPVRVQKVGSVSFVHPQTLAEPPPPQVTLVPLQVPQLSVPPHPSPTLPQFFPSALQLVGVQPHTLGTLGVAPPQVCGKEHAPHRIAVRKSPQLSGALRFPQFFWFRLQKVGADSGVQPHTFAKPGLPPPHVRPVPEQTVPQFTVRCPPQRSVTNLSPHDPTPQLVLTSVDKASPTQSHTPASLHA